MVLQIGVLTGSARVEAAETDVDQRIEALERELEALKREVGEKDSTGGAPAQEEPPAQQEAKSKASKDVSLLPTWQVTDGITFKPGFRVQGRYSYSEMSDHTFQIKRFRLKGSGELFGIAKYGAELKIDGTGTRPINSDSPAPGAGVENAWVEFTKLQDVKARFGLYDIPFSRSNLTSDSKLLFMDRSLIRGLLSSVGLSDNTIGALFHGRPFGGRFEYATGVFQNDNFGTIPTWSGRIVANLLDPPKQGGYGDYRGSYIGNGRRLAISANGAYTPSVGTGLEEFDLYAIGSDLFFNMGPFTLQMEFDWYKKDMRTGPAIVTLGGYVQGGLLLGPLFDRWESAPSILDSIELAARYQDVDDEDVNEARLRWTSVGLNYYIRSHNLKVQMDYTWKNPTPTVDENDLFQLQLQLDF
jgi:hypothetical protein